MPKRTDISLPTKPSPQRGRGWRASARRVRGQERRDGFQHAVHIGEHLVVPEANDLETFRFEEGSARGVRFCAVLPAIDLHDQSRLEAEKVRDEAADGHLPAELRVVQLPVPQSRPQQHLRISRVSTQTAYLLSRNVRHSSPSPGRFATSLSRKGRGYKAMIV